MRNLALIFFLLCTLGNFKVQAGDHGSARPNIIVILVDDMGWSDIGSYGGEIATPNLDKLAENGLRYSQFYNTSRCSPTRASLLTGLYPHQAGLGYLESLAIPHSQGTYGKLANRAVTIAEVLGTAGYFTAMTGKWHIGQTRDVPPWKRGFHRSLSHSLGAIYFPDQKTKSEKNLYLNGKSVPFNSPILSKDYWYSTDLWTTWGTKFIDEALANKQPFFLYLAHVAPHFPVMAPAADIERYRGKYMLGWDKLREERYKRQIKMGLIKKRWRLSERLPEVPAWEDISLEEQERYDHIMAVYAAAIDRMDKSIGKLVKHLKTNNILDNTLILFMSDNGSSAEGGPLGVSGGSPLGGPSSRVFVGMNWATLHDTPFRYFKHFTHEGGISTPLIAHWPNGIDKILNGTINHEPGHVIDIMSTVVELSGAHYPKKFNGHDILPQEGTSLVPTFLSKTLIRNEPLFWEHEGNRAVRLGKWKLVSKYRGPWQLYNLEKDRTETRDLFTRYPKIARDLIVKYENWVQSDLVDQWRGPERPNYGSTWTAKPSKYLDSRLTPQTKKANQ